MFIVKLSEDRKINFAIIDIPHCVSMGCIYWGFSAKLKLVGGDLIKMSMLNEISFGLTFGLALSINNLEYCLGEDAQAMHQGAERSLMQSLAL